VGPYVVGEHPDGIPNPRGTRIVGCRPNCSLPQKLTDQFVLLPSLGFRCFARGHSGALAAAFLAIPPFKKIVAGTFIPDVSISDPVETDKFPQASSNSDLFDDPNTLLGHPARSPWGVARGGFGSVVLPGAGRVHRRVRGVYYRDFIDTKRVSLPAKSHFLLLLQWFTRVGFPA
jgi:hypothetical protein